MIKFENVTKRYGKKEILHSISLDIPKGKIVSIIGRSGCGKTTMLKMINRLIPITSGHILINKKNILNMDPVDLRRNIGYVIQQTGLFPHMTVYKNLELVLALHRYPKKEREERIDEIMEKMGLTPDLLNHYPIELSGGQQQRIGVARALITDPEVILMDEPFSALDYQQRLLLADEVHSIIKRGGYTAVLVTHDISEAICMSDRVIILSERPARIRKQVEINMGSDTPLERRSNPLFREYYDAVWSEFRLAGERQQLMPTENANTQKGV